MTDAQTFNRVADKKSNLLLIYWIKDMVIYTEKMALIKQSEGEEMIIKTGAFLIRGRFLI
jgi:hypothetical protein